MNHTYRLKFSCSSGKKARMFEARIKQKEKKKAIGPTFFFIICFKFMTDQSDFFHYQ